MATSGRAGESADEQLIRMIGEEYQREESAKRNQYGGLSALCQATFNLPIFPKLSEKEEKKLTAWKKEIFKALTNKKSPGALKLEELKKNIIAQRRVGERQSSSVTTVELMSHVPELVSILNLYLKTVKEKHPNMIFFCIRVFVLVLQVVLGLPMLSIIG